MAPRVLVESWVYLKKGQDEALAQEASKTLAAYPEKMLLSVAQAEVESWALAELALAFGDRENLLEAILLNPSTPDFIFVEIAKKCSERLTQMICNNEERIIQAPEIIPALETNKNNLKSNTERLRHFLKLAGIPVPGDHAPVIEEKPIDISKLDTDSAEEKTDAQKEEEIARALQIDTGVTEEQRTNLLKMIAKLSVGGKIKLGMKGNRECRYALIRDVNAIVALAVLKSPKMTEPEVAAYARMRNLCDDVIRVISSSPAWTKSYEIKLAVCLHPKAPLQAAMGFIKFLTLKDLNKVSKDRNIPGPTKKAAKQLLDLKRK